MTTSGPSVASSGWPLWQRVGFRYLLLHWLAYAFTDPQGNPFISLLGAIRFWLDKIASWPRDWGWFDVDLAGWTDDVGEWLYDAQGTKIDQTPNAADPDHGWCRQFTTWLSDKSATLNDDEPMFEVFHQVTGSGDTMHEFVRLCSIVVVAILLTALWSLIDRSRGYPKIGRWLHLGARWYVALQMLSYGMAKFLGTTQFPEPGIFGLTREVGDHHPMGIVWTFMGVNPAYKYFSGFGELLGFALLLHPWTALVGCFVTAGVMTNVCALNFFCGVPVKLYSGHLLLIAVFLMAPYAPRLWAVFVSNRPSQPVDIRVARVRWLSWPLLLVGTLWASGVVWNEIDAREKRLEQYPRLKEMMIRPQLFGLWKVEQMKLDGAQVPPSDSSRWEYLAIDRGNSAYAKTLLGQRFSWKIVENLEANEVELKPRRGDGSGEVWTIERSTVTRKVRNRTPKKREEWGRMVDGEVPKIVFKGKWKGKDLELHTVQKQFYLHDEFRLIREFPR